MKKSTKYCVVSDVYCGGGVQSEHRTLSGAMRAIARHDAAISSLNRGGGTYYHDCSICEIVDGVPTPCDPQDAEYA